MISLLASKEDAIKAMRKGFKISHEYFDCDEYIYMNKEGEITTEDGYYYEDEFHRKDEEWHEKWIKI